ncbi:MAG: alpha/beta fold hydrolase [Proteobacteria bacterium]|nr:alpha/beta fold hydrolase [Pseudomonadota bacterium]MDA1357561.1 alpha/beta fold hydrolase [Pseudomonadota bacterium]
MRLETIFTDSSPRIAADCLGAGPVVLFLHGIGGNRSNWRDQLPAFAERYLAVAWDARGYGLSDGYDGALNFADFSADLARLLDQLKAEKAHLVGLSMGGRVAADFYFRSPNRVASLTLVDTHSGFAALSPAQRKEYVESRLAPLKAGKTVADIAPVVADKLLGPNATAEVRARLEASIASLRQDCYMKSVAATVEQDSVGDYSAIHVPTHVMVGEHDPLTTPAMCRELADQIKRAAFSIVPDAGHLSNIENPAAFNASALEFIDSISA